MNETSHLIKSFVIRQGRMTKGQKRGWENWSKWGLERQNGKLNATCEFGNLAPLVMEIGFGMGSSLIKMAIENANMNFIGIEVHKPGVGKLLTQILQNNLNNIRVYCDDAVQILTDCIQDHSLDRIQIYFPDPWHKKKHLKRRLIQANFGKILRQKIIVGGILHLATDIEDYARQMRNVLSEEIGWRQLCSTKSPRRQATKFEIRGRKQGSLITDLLFTTI